LTDLTPVRIVVADGRPLYRRGLAALLSAQPGWQVVGKEDTGLGAVAAVQDSEPDVAVLDLDLAAVDGIETTRRIATASPATGVLMLAWRDDEDGLLALRAGARGFLPKGAADSDIVRAVGAVARGEAVLAAAVARRVVEFFRAGRSDRLTPREHEVLDLVAAGWTTADISKVLVLSPGAVGRHVSGIVAELQRAEPDVPERTAPVVRLRQPASRRGRRRRR
jgi:DNA-binding NarL/FixJ family response regulator